jgi:hypothetical protein
MAKNHQHRGAGTATSIAKKKSAMDELLDSFAEIIDSGAAKMNSSQLQESEKRFNQIADRVAASRKRQRETA